MTLSERELYIVNSMALRTGMAQKFKSIIPALKEFTENNYYKSLSKNEQTKIEDDIDAFVKQAQKDMMMMLLKAGGGKKMGFSGLLGLGGTKQEDIDKITKLGSETAMGKITDEDQGLLKKMDSIVRKALEDKD